jgi:hypothetical protein
MFVLGGWFRNDALKRAQHLLTDGRYLQLDANLRYFYRRYEAILAERDADERWTDVVRGEEFRRNRAVYYAYIERARDAVAAAVEKLAELEGIREELSREAYEEWKARTR